MKKLLLLALVGLCLSSANAQNNAAKADDGSRIAITPTVTDQDIPSEARDLLLNKMKQICAKNGLSGDTENPFFIMDASVDVLSKELTPSAPPMHALNLQINLFIKDAATGNVYSETSVQIKGVGQNETKAYIAGLKNINPAQGQFKAMVDRGKEKILEFYNSQCDFVISKATALQKQGNNKEAIKVLKSVPPVSKECYDKCMEILATIEHVEEPVAVKKDTVIVIVNTQAPASTATPAASAPASAPATSTAPVGAVAASAPVAAATTQPQGGAPTLLVGDAVLVCFDDNVDFWHKRYLPSKVQTLPSAASKGETQFIAINDETPRDTWTTDMITKWHMAASSELRDGVVVIYTEDDIPNVKSVYYPGIIVMTDELYKGILSIKGRWGDIHKIETKCIAIADNPVVVAP